VIQRLLALALALALALGCSARNADPPSEWARSVAEKHAEADARLARGERAAAQRELESILTSAPQREPSLPSDAVRILLQDTHYRLARLALDEEQPDEAVRIASAGLALGGDLALRDDDLYVANLLVARGVALESLGDLDAALADYARALAINERLLRETLEVP
jgi:tetratricopeptide (TPR) repeat protein